ncbi:MAG: serine/threonine protein phosphatase [Methylobacteriaceae bacterium]|nr:serine/threonine protein phosphatase [Methylobacteriaceae bacterium]
MLTYAVGDSHGRLDLLQRLLAEIARHAGQRPHRLVFLGDYIDRGPDSAGVVATVRQLQAERPDGTVVALKGNHEDFLLRSRTDPDVAETWLANGGEETLASYGARGVRELPADVLDWLARLPTAFEDEARVYVHAGLDPARPRDGQTDHDRLWIRERFLGQDHDFGKFVVHGHTPCRTGRPDLRPYRVNLDTAAVYGGRLTAGVFEDGTTPPVDFLSVPA